jgi:hypothetical protein
MTSATRLPYRWVCALGALMLATAAHADGNTADANPTTPASPTGLSYRLNGNFPNLATPTTVQMPLHFASDFGLLPRGQELMLSTTPSAVRLPDWMQSMFPGSVAGVGLDATRATYRYTFLESDAWALKVGLTSTLTDSQPGLGYERWRLGGTPMMHLSGSSHFGGWTLSLDADGLHTARGRAVDLDLQVDYGLGRDLSLFGGYRMIETAGDVEDFYGPAPSNTANVGIRLRF